MRWTAARPLRIAIVNRGEPAMRALHSIVELTEAGTIPCRSIALFTDPDAAAPFVRLADEALSIGPAQYLDPADARTKHSYLDKARVEAALIAAKADAVWVGWGFLAEDAQFAARCAALGIIFIGPAPAAMARLGDKIEAKRAAEAAGVPVVPWSGGGVDSVEAAREAAARIGFPLMIKAAAGGGGRGIREVGGLDEIDAAFASARHEAEHAFGDPTVFLERRVASGRHLEVQILADNAGTIWVLGVRECSVQRRRQKVIEESHPAFDGASVIARLSDHARQLCAAVGYTNAGTVEFLYDPEADQVYFMEVNTRLQVEHTVTEMVTGVDLVRCQIEIACGGRLDGPEPTSNGHAIEVRLNAEDPDRGFAAAPGRVALCRFPAGPGIRVDSGVGQGDTIPPDFDSMIAKIIAWGPDRAAALHRLQRALQQTDVVIDGGTTNKSFLLDLVRRPEIASGDFHTAWLEQTSAETPHHFADVALLLGAIAAHDEQVAAEYQALACTAQRGRLDTRPAPPRRIDLGCRGTTYGFRVAKRDAHRYRVTTDDGVADVVAQRNGAFEWMLVRGPDRYRALCAPQGGGLHIEVRGISHRIQRDDGGLVRNPSPAVVVALLVAEGDRVTAGAPLLVVESMKMESSVCATTSGTVRDVVVARGAQVGAGDVMMRLVADAETSEAASGDRVRFAGDTPEGDLAAERRALLLGFDAEPGDADVALALADEGALLALFAELCATDPPTAEEQALGARADDPLLARLRGDEASDALRSLIPRYAAMDEGEALLRLARSRRSAREQEKIVRAILLRWSAVPAELLSDQRRIAPLLDQLAAVGGRRSASIANLASMLATRLADLEGDAAQQSGALAQLMLRLDTLAGEPIASADGLAAELAMTTLPWTSWLLPWLHDFRRRTTLARLVPWSRGKARAGLIRAMAVMARIEYRHLTLDFETPAAARAPVISATTTAGRVTRRVWALVGNDIGRDHLHDMAAAASADPPCDDVVIEILLVGARRVDFAAADRAARIIARKIPAATTIVLSFSATPTEVETHVFQPNGTFATEVERRLHPGVAARCETWRLAHFETRLVEATPTATLVAAAARGSTRDRRLVALAEVRDLSPADGEPFQMPALERALRDAIDLIRRHQAAAGDAPAHLWNRVFVNVEPVWTLPIERLAEIGARIAPTARNLQLEQILLRLRLVENGGIADRIVILAVTEAGVQLGTKSPSDEPWRILTDERARRADMQRLGLAHPAEVIRTLTSPGATYSDLPPGGFQEHELDEAGRLTPIERPSGEHRANLLVGIVRNRTRKHPEGMRRVLILSDPSRSLGSLGDAECSRIVAAIDLAAALDVPVEWFSVSSGARVSMESGTENMDATARVLRRIIEFTQAGGEINIVVTGINVGAQSYWNAEATMLMHTRGTLIMVGDSALVLTGKQALDYSGAVSADTNAGIGGYQRIMGPNGEAQHWAPTIEAACALLFRHYDYSYVVPGELGPRGAFTTDAPDRDIGESPLAAVEGSTFEWVADAFSATLNPERKKPFDIRSVMRAVADRDDDPLERWLHMRDADTAVVWDAHVGGIAVRLIGIEAHERTRSTVAPADGPQRWTAGTLFPRSSKKVARAINAASGNRPVVVLANLSGFDGSPESMRELQLEYGAEIGRAVVNFEGPIIFCVLSRYHGGAFVVFSKALNDNLQAIALEGAYASVLGGAPAAAVVFARDVERRAGTDVRVAALRAEAASALPSAQARLAVALDEALSDARGDARTTIAAEFDAIHTIERARAVGSIDSIVPASALRLQIITSLSRASAAKRD